MPTLRKKKSQINSFIILHLTETREKNKMVMKPKASRRKKIIDSKLNIIENKKYRK